MASSKAVDRTALTDFKFAGKPVKAGQVVSVPDSRKLKEMVAKGLVCDSDDDDAAVPKLGAAGSLQTSSTVGGTDDADKAAKLATAQRTADDAKAAATKARAAAMAIGNQAAADVAAKTKAANDATVAEAAASKAQTDLDALKAG
jgi:hypothetical protein